MRTAQIASQMPKLEEARVRGCQKKECLGQSARVRQAASRRSFLQRDRLTAWVSSWEVGKPDTCPISPFTETLAID